MNLKTANRTLVAMAIASSFVLAGCQTTTATSSEEVANPPVASVVATPADFGSSEITLEQAMAHPDWLGRQAERAFWAADSSTIVYAQKQQGNELRDLYVQGVNSQSANKVALNKLHTLGASNAVYSANRLLQAYVYEGNIFIKNIKINEITQITHDSAKQSNPQFLTDGNLAFRQGNTFYKVNLTTGLQTELANLHLNDAPKGIIEPQTYIAKEQHKLIDYIALTHKNKLDKQTRKEQLKSQNASIANAQFYLGKGNKISDVQLSPSGKALIAVVTDNRSWREDSDIMPNYITDDAGVKAEKVRRRVADAKPQTSKVIYIDLEENTQKTLAFDTLPGFDEDVLATVKKENYAREGKTYESKKEPRAINLIMDWGWSQSAIVWNHDGSQVALMLEAWDNKDRWIASVDFENNTLVSQHRLHDDAWVNYTYNDFGWLNNSDTLYYLSEESGYSHIYKKPLNGKATQLTKGQFVVSNLTLSDDNSAIYYKANVEHPGLYEIYRVDPQTAQSEQITNLDGMTDYQLSPDQTKLLLTHSKIMAPPELYVADAKANASAKQLTNMVSSEFLAKQLIAPKIVAVPSSHTDQPIYAKVYYPADYVEGESGNERKAVIFNHGAGYLQNSHMGWSGYFREFMFHSLLASEGYVVMDMDYRASKGYGRDWRTAIYRQMGTPETQDLMDGVSWMAENANVDTGAVGTYGGSYGGFMTFMALFTQPDLFQSGAALRPVTDWAHYNAPYTSNILNHPDVDPIAYEKSSPIYYAEGLKNHLLINAPMVDNNVFFQDSVRLVQRLIELEKENFETAIFPVEPHGFVQPSSWLDEYRRIYKLFKETL
ncbi:MULTISPECIES: prolyl oligopeptidase family serine peptidase [unclassified Pseudoalteromonas]|uniref:S9 family peptidase n=1 Tax=unclassified Pseudoalteromonas TaxID=194690 RepID=UPI0025B3BA65|nr:MULTISPECIES: prolyl oligopeptidase family serine peptidase [unclassified Pseudoalteromonas]MDN3377939.1 prolyl oligopeptidase family serine peptidase [Pseudoalteromonas sp. APC 3893]MDN3386134.1 prolyl oligopeptidase family serine peptidase [Pseudoalteromonas sp. APC 4017]